MRSQRVMIGTGALSCAAMLSFPMVVHGQVCGPVELTQNVDPDTITDGRGVACEGGGTGLCSGLENITFETRYARSYDLSTCPTADQEFAVSCVTFAVEFNTIAGYEVFVNIYEDIDGGAPDSTPGDLVMLGTASAIVPELPDPDPNDGVDSPFITVDFTGGGGSPVYVPANAQMVVELVLPTRDDMDCGRMRPGFNDLGETAEGYLKSVPCGVPEYRTFSFLGFNFNHLILVVNGEPAESVQPCPADCVNADGQVDINDMLGLLAGWGLSGQACDIVGEDDTIDINDMLALLGTWGPCSARPPYCTGDIDNSDTVDINDLLSLLGEWGLVFCSPADLDYSGEVDINDLLELLGAWGPCPG